MAQVGSQQPQPSTLQAHWKTFTEEHPTAARFMILSGGVALGAAAKMAPALFAASGHSTGLQTSGTFHLNPHNSLSPMFAGYYGEDFEVQWVTDPPSFSGDAPSFLERCRRAAMNLFGSSPAEDKIDTATIFAPPRVDFVAPAIRKLSFIRDMSDFPKIGDFDLPELTPNKPYRVDLPPTLASHPTNLAIQLLHHPASLRYDWLGLSLRGTIATDQIPKQSPLVQLIAVEQGVDNPLVTTTHLHLPVKGVVSQRDEIHVKMAQGRELHRLPIEQAFFPEGFDTLDVRHLANSSYPEGWVHWDPNTPDTLLLNPPDDLVQVLEQFALVIEAYKDGNPAGELTVYSTVSPQENEKPYHRFSPFKPWKPKKGRPATLQLDYANWRSPLDREIVQIHVTIHPRTSFDKTSWLEDDFCQNNAFFYGTPPKGIPAFLTVKMRATDSHGAVSEEVELRISPKKKPLLSPTKIFLLTAFCLYILGEIFDGETRSYLAGRCSLYGRRCSIGLRALAHKIHTTICGTGTGPRRVVDDDTGTEFHQIDSDEDED